jgi:glutaredoxin
MIGGGSMKTLTILVVTALFFSATSIQAEMYKWEDENGVVTFKDTPPPKSKKRKVKVYRDSDFDPAPAPPPVSKKTGNSATAHAPAKPAEKARFNGNIEMYVTDWCPVCKKAEKYIAEKGYPVLRYDIEKDKAAERRYKELGGHGVPLILVGSNRISGFSAQLLERYLGNE